MEATAGGCTGCPAGFRVRGASRLNEPGALNLTQLPRRRASVLPRPSPHMADHTQRPSTHTHAHTRALATWCPRHAEHAERAPLPARTSSPKSLTQMSPRVVRMMAPCGSSTAGPAAAPPATASAPSSTTGRSLNTSLQAERGPGRGEVRRTQGQPLPRAAGQAFRGTARPREAPRCATWSGNNQRVRSSTRRTALQGFRSSALWKAFSAPAGWLP